MRSCCAVIMMRVVARGVFALRPGAARAAPATCRSASTTAAAAEINPLLAQKGLPLFGSIEASNVVPAVSSLLTSLETDLSALEASLSASSSYAETIYALERISAPISYAWGVVGHLNGVKNSEELRAAHAEMQPRVVEVTQKLGQSRAVLTALDSLAQNSDKLDATQRRVVDASLLSMRLGGVQLEGAAKEQYNANSLRLSTLSTDFSNNVMDATKAYELLIVQPSDVQGLPASALAAAAQKAQAAGKCETADAAAGPWLLGLDGPSYVPAMKFLESSALREQLYRAFTTRAGAENAPLIDQILELKQKQAGLLGFETYADVSLASKMADSVQAVNELHDMLSAKALPAARRELAELQTYADARGATEQLRHWDLSFWSEKMREEKFGFSEEELRPYFALPNVLQGLFDLIERLFGVVVEQADGEEQVWQEDVRFFVVKDADSGERVASFFLDPYSRPENKRGGAWMDTCVGKSKALNRGVPTAYLTCNGSPPVGDKPSLMTFNEVETLYHEMGHGLQHMLTRVDEGDAAGISGVEWDAVELPSQFMENWLLDKPTLYSFAKHYETGEPLPEAYFEKLKGSKVFQAGLGMSRQIAFGALDVDLHSTYDASAETPFEAQKRVFAKHAAMPPLEGDRFLCAFGHIFAGGYACGYYSYKWAEVLSADAFAAFEEAGLDDDAAVRALGKKFRETVLGLGGGTHPSDVFKQFRGRAASPDALIKHSGLA